MCLQRKPCYPWRRPEHTSSTRGLQSRLQNASKHTFIQGVRLVVLNNQTHIHKGHRSHPQAFYSIIYHWLCIYYHLCMRSEVLQMYFLNKTEFVFMYACKLCLIDVHVCEGCHVKGAVLMGSTIVWCSYLQRLDCIKQAENTLLTPHDATLNEYVPDRFLCSGGSADHIDAVTCKGMIVGIHSMGSHIIQLGNTYIN